MFSSREVIPVIRYKRVGHCIYCKNEDNLPLSNEHIVPLGISGRWILPASSCTACAAITSDFDGQCQESMMGAAKTQLGLRRRKHPRPAKWIMAPVGEKPAALIQAVPIHDHPSAIVMFQFGLTGITLGVPETGKYDIRIHLVPVVKDFRDRVARTGEKIWFNTSGASPQYFARMLAKIAHAYAVAEAGASKFKPLLLDQILGSEPPRIGALFGTEIFNEAADLPLSFSSTRS
jgi:hypothetical protein